MDELLFQTDEELLVITPTQKIKENLRVISVAKPRRDTTSPDTTDYSKILSPTDTKPIDIPKKKEKFVPDYPTGRP